jgi:chromosome partitioning protein
MNSVFEEATMRSIPVALLPEGQAAARPYIDLALEIRNKHAMEGAHDAETAGLF